MVNRSERNIVIIVPTQWEAHSLHDEIMPGLTPDRVFHNRPYPTYTQDFPDGRLVLIESYIAPHNAGGAAGWAIATHKPTFLLMAGSAGATRSDLIPGDIVVGCEYQTIFPTSTQQNRRLIGLPSAGVRYLVCGKPILSSVVEADQMLLMMAVRSCDEIIPKLPTWPGMSRSPRFVTGRIGTMDDWTTKKEELEELAKQGIDAEDMETAAVAMVAASHGIPFLAIRGVANNGVLGIRPNGLEEVKSMSAKAARNAGEIIADLIVRLKP